MGEAAVPSVVQAFPSFPPPATASASRPLPIRSLDRRDLMILLINVSRRMTPEDLEPAVPIMMEGLGDGYSRPVRWAVAHLLSSRGLVPENAISFVEGDGEGTIARAVQIANFKFRFGGSGRAPAGRGEEADARDSTWKPLDSPSQRAPTSLMQFASCPVPQSAIPSRNLARRR